MYVCVCVVLRDGDDGGVVFMALLFALSRIAAGGAGYGLLVMAGVVYVTHILRSHWRALSR